MKHYFLILIASIICVPILLSGKEETDRIIGYWLTGDKATKIEIYQNEDGTFAGKIIWLQEPNDAKGNPKKDINNPDVKLQQQPLIDLIVLSDFVRENRNKYKNGEYYEPTTGKTYSAKIELINNNTITIRYFIGVPTLGRTDTWIRSSN